MIVHAHPVEAGVLAPRDDLGNLRDRAPDGDPDVYLHSRLFSVPLPLELTLTTDAAGGAGEGHRAETR
jgi:hypothetical protein